MSLSTRRTRLVLTQLALGPNTTDVVRHKPEHDCTTSARPQ